MSQPPVDTITFLISDVARILRQRHQQALDAAGAGITEGENRALHFINRYPDLNQKALSDLMGLEPMTLLGYLSRLESVGLIERFPDPDDRRAKRMRITKAGEQVLEISRAVGKATRAAIARQLGTDESERLRNGIAALREVLVNPPAEDPQA
jgi:DNA-binding MarR family transcriptional regulator